MHGPLNVKPVSGPCISVAVLKVQNIYRTGTLEYALCTLPKFNKNSNSSSDILATAHQNTSRH